MKHTGTIWVIIGTRMVPKGPTEKLGCAQVVAESSFPQQLVVVMQG